MEDKHKNNAIIDLVEQSAKPIMSAKKYWHESISNIIKDIRKRAYSKENYTLLLEAEVLYLRKLWNKELDIIYIFARENKIPDQHELNNIIAYIEEESITEIKDDRIHLKNGGNLNKEELSFIERYTAISEIEARQSALEEDYIYLKIRDYITLNMMQFISENKEVVLEILKKESRETVQRIADLICNFADVCMWVKKINVAKTALK